MMARVLALAAVVMLLAACPAFHAGRPPGTPPRGAFTKVDGVDMRYWELGPRDAASTVVMLHGFGSSLDVWATVAPRVAMTHRVVAIDMKGFGWSGRPEGDYSPKAQTALILKLLDGLGVNKAAFVGHSWGGSVVLRLALEAPKRVTRIALYGAWIYDEQLPTFLKWAQPDGVGESLFTLFYKERAEERLARAFYNPDKIITEEYFEYVEETLDRPGTLAAALAAARGQKYGDIQDRYSEIKVPALLLWGEQDRVSDVSFGQRLARQLGDAKLRVYNRCGHFPMVEAFGTSTRDLVEFLAKTDIVGAGSGAKGAK